MYPNSHYFAPAPQIARARLKRTVLFLLLAPFAAAAETDPLTLGENAAREWIRVRTETNQLETEWKLQRPLLESTVAALQERAGSLEEKRDGLTAKTAKDREEIAALKATKTQTEAELAEAQKRLDAVAARLVQIRPTLPPRLSEALEFSYRTLADPKVCVGERMQTVVTMLGRCMQFNRGVSLGEEVLAIDSGPPRSLEVIYLGLGQGYALDRAAGKVWRGGPGSAGWQWEPRPESRPAIERLIAIYNDKADPEFVPVPAVLAHPAAEGAK